MSLERALGIVLVVLVLAVSAIVIITRVGPPGQSALRPAAVEEMPDRGQAPAATETPTVTSRGLSASLSDMFAEPTRGPRVLVRVLSPPDHSTVWLGQPVQVQVAVSGPKAVRRLELRVDGTPVSSMIPGTTATDLTQALKWSPQAVGTAEVQVVVYFADGAPVEATPVILVVQDNTAMMTAIAERLGEPTAATATPGSTRPARAQPTATAGRRDTRDPGVTPEPSATPRPDAGPPDVSTGF